MFVSETCRLRVDKGFNPNERDCAGCDNWQAEQQGADIHDSTARCVGSCVLSEAVRQCPNFGGDGDEALSSDGRALCPQNRQTNVGGKVDYCATDFPKGLE
jgi:hypothetical protein